MTTIRTAPTAPTTPSPATTPNAATSGPLSAATASTRRPKGSGTVRERRPGVWEVRVTTGPLAVGAARGRGQQRSVTVRGTRQQAEATRETLTAAAAAAAKSETCLGPPSVVTVAELLTAWLAADHPWRPSTEVGYRSTVRGLVGDPIAQTRVQRLMPAAMRQTLRRWASDGVTASTSAARFRVLRSAMSWGYDERVLDTRPLRHTRGPGRVPPRRPVSDDDVRRLLATAELQLLEAVANDTPSGPTLARYRAELDLLLVRLAADTGARRGELTALRLDDLAGTTGRVLSISRSVSAGQLVPPKSGHPRALTVGATTAALWHQLAQTWRDRAHGTGIDLGPWVFTADLAHHDRLGAEVLGHRFIQLRDRACVSDATLHRLRHSVSTYLVSHGQILQAQARLGHADAATTLREYAYALPLTDGDVADALDTHLSQLPEDRPTPPRPGQARPGS